MKPFLLLLLACCTACAGAADSLSNSPDGGDAGAPDASVDAGIPDAGAGTDGGTVTDPGGGGGGAPIPQPTTDGPAQFLVRDSIDYGNLQGVQPGGIPVGNSRTVQEFVANISKKTPLTISSISVVGANPGDFTVPEADIATATGSALPPNKSAVASMHVTFTPTAAGTRTASLQIVSNAGTISASLTGVGLPLIPILGPLDGTLSFIPTSGLQTLTLKNEGGATLVLQSFALTGTGQASFEIAIANSGQSNCFAGEDLGPLADCLLGVSLSPEASAPANATLTIQSNDPAHPQTNISLSLTAAP